MSDGPDLGGVVVDLEGGQYGISRPIVFPVTGGGNLNIIDGSVRGTGTAPKHTHAASSAGMCLRTLKPPLPPTHTRTRTRAHARARTHTHLNLESTPVTCDEGRYRDWPVCSCQGSIAYHCVLVQLSLVRDNVVLQTSPPLHTALTAVVLGFRFPHLPSCFYAMYCIDAANRCGRSSPLVQ